MELRHHYYVVFAYFCHFYDILQEKIHGDQTISIEALEIIANLVRNVSMNTKMPSVLSPNLFVFRYSEVIMTSFFHFMVKNHKVIKCSIKIVWR